MVQLISPSTPEPFHQKPLDVDYNSPTELFKFLEAKKWDMVKERIEECPHEAASWITRRGKDGSIRWKILPLHAALCTKAPKDTLLSIVQAYTKACSLADDQGVLPIHLAFQDEHIDEEVIKIILQSNPSGLTAKDKEGKVIMGRPMLLALKILQDMEVEKIRLEEKEREISLVQSTNLGSGFQKYIKLRKVNDELQENVETLKIELAIKDDKLQNALTKLASQEESIANYREMSKNVCELRIALTNITEIKTTASKLQEQLDSQERNLLEQKLTTTETKELMADIESQERSLRKQTTTETKEMTAEIENKVDGIVFDAKHVYLTSLEKLTSFLNDTIIQSKSLIEKIEDSYKPKDSSEDGEHELATISSQHQVLLEKVTKFMDESMNQFNDQMLVMKDTMRSKGLDLDSIESKAAEVAEMVNNSYRALRTALKEQFEKIDETYKVQDKCRAALKIITKHVNDIIVQLNDEMNNIKEQIKDGRMQAYLLDTKEKGLVTVNDMLKAYYKKVADNMDYLCHSGEKSNSCVHNADYHFSPTEMFKFIEAKEWDMVKLRVEECPEEAGSWITKRRKNGTIRWKLLPLHALLCIKAPTDVVLPVLNAYPEACSLPDDLGNLPIDIAKNAEKVNEEVVTILLEKNPSGEVKEDAEECENNPSGDITKNEELQLNGSKDVTKDEEECETNSSGEVTKEEGLEKNPSEVVTKVEEDCENPSEEVTKVEEDCENPSEEVTKVEEDCEIPSVELKTIAEECDSI